MRKLISLVLLLVTIFVFATWQYRLTCLLLIVLLNKKSIKELPFISKWKYSYPAVVCVIIACIYFSMPNYFQRGRIQLVYLDRNGKSVGAPLPVYFANAIIPEKEVYSLGIKALYAMPKLQSYFLIGPRLANDLREDINNGKGKDFHKPYDSITATGSNPGSFAYAQFWNKVTGDDHDGIYVIRPDGFDESKTYPVVFYCHGLLGSWELYQGILARLENCIVVSIGTRDLSGIFTRNDVDKVFTKYIPYLESAGYRIDKDQMHIIGLSNGGSASDTALTDYPGRFKSITFISTPCHTIKKSKAKVILIGGGKDSSSTGLPAARKQLEKCGTECAILFDENANHYIIVHETDRIVDFLNKELDLI